MVYGSDLTLNFFHQSSDINASGDLYIQSGGNTNIISSNIDVGTLDEHGNVIKGGNTTIIAGKYLDETGNEVYDKDAKVNIIAAKNVERIARETSKMSVKFNDLDKIARSGVAYGLVGAALASVKFEYQDNTHITNITTNQSSNVNTANNLAINSASNTNIIASNVNVGNDAVILAGTMYVNGEEKINNDANINIISAKDIISSEIKNSELTIAFDAELDLDINTGSFEILTKKSYQENNVASSLNVGNNLDINAANNINLIASNILSGGDASLIAGNEVNILSSQNYSSASSSKLSGTTGVDFTLNFNEASVAASISAEYEDQDNQQTRQSSANIMANNLTIESKNDINIKASNLYANNDINLTSNDGSINILSANELTKEDRLYMALELGVKAGITYNLGETFDSLKSLKDVDFENFTGVGQLQAIIEMEITGSGLLFKV